MQVDIGNNKICHNFSSIVSSAEIRDLNERVQQEYPHEGGGTGTSSAPQRRVDPNAGLTPTPTHPARLELASRTARRSSLNLSRSSAGSRHSLKRAHSARHAPHGKHSSTPHSRSGASPDEAALPPPPPPPPSSALPLSPTQEQPHGNHFPDATAHTPSMAAVAAPAHRQGGNWNDAARTGIAAGEHGTVNGNNYGAAAAAMNSNNGNHSNLNNGKKNNADGSRRADDAANGNGNGNGNAGSQDNNGSGNQDKPAQPAGPKLAQTKIQLGMRLRRWVIINRIGAGSFGETFTAMEVDGPIAEEDSLTVTPENLALLDHLPPLEERREVCIKVEQENKNVLRLEALALKKVQPCPQVVRYLGSGCTNGMNYLVMEKLGPNLAELRRRSQHGTFNIYTTLKAGISCLTAIRGVHDLGLVHRDIKPSNFVTGLPGSAEHTTCYLIDFGLARRFRRSNGEIRPPRDNAGFRGTSRYASVASHHHQELGRVDDLWSLLFMLVEFATGTLPWRKYKDKDDIGRCKEESITPHLVRNLPREFQPFLAHLQTLRYEDEPDYDLLTTLMLRALERRGYPPNKPVEWEMDPSMMDSAADLDGHENGARNEAERPPAPNPAPSPAVNSQKQQQQQQQQPQQPQLVAVNISPAHDVAANSGHTSPASRQAAPSSSQQQQQQLNLSENAVRKAQQQQQPLRTPLSPGGLQSNGGANNSRSTPAAVDLINAPAENVGSGTPQHHNSGMLRVSDVDVVGDSAGNRLTAAEASIAPPQFGAPMPGTFEEPGAASGFPAEGSETPAARDTSDDDFDPNEFSPREQPSPSNRDHYSRNGNSSGRPGSAPPPAASATTMAAPAANSTTPSAAAVPPASSALEPNNSTQWRESGDRRSSGQPAHPHGDGEAFSESHDAMAKIGNAPLQQQRPMGGPAVDLDAPNNDNVEMQQGAEGKAHSKDKKKSNCDCKVM